MAHMFSTEEVYYKKKDSKVFNRYVLASNADPVQTAEEQSDKGLHCLGILTHVSLASF